MHTWHERHKVVIVFTFVALREKSPSRSRRERSRKTENTLRGTEEERRSAWKDTRSALFPWGQTLPRVTVPVTSKLFKSPGGFQLIKLKSTVVFFLHRYSRCHIMLRDYNDYNETVTMMRTTNPPRSSRKYQSDMSIVGEVLQSWRLDFV